MLAVRDPTGLDRPMPDARCPMPDARSTDAQCAMVRCPMRDCPRPDSSMCDRPRPDSQLPRPDRPRPDSARPDSPIARGPIARGPIARGDRSSRLFHRNLLCPAGSARSDSSTRVPASTCAPVAMALAPRPHPLPTPGRVTQRGFRPDGLKHGHRTLPARESRGSVLDPSQPPLVIDAAVPLRSSILISFVRPRVRGTAP